MLNLLPRFGELWPSDAEEARTATEMAWTKLTFSRDQVNTGAKSLVAYEYGDPQSVEEMESLYDGYIGGLPAINNWRSAHSFPLNTFRMNLNRTSAKIDSNSLTAQRIKRLSSISLKLHRFPRMKLSQMQDIGGCRAVVRDMGRLLALSDIYRSKSQVKHKIVHVDDYVKEPQKSGYRGIHLIWRYNSDKSVTYNDMKIEMQLRTNLQHAWATAVETVGTFLEQALKSSIGSPQWLRFFALMGNAMAERENSPTVPNTPIDKKDWLKELVQVARELDVENRLASFSNALQVAEDPALRDSDYYLLQIDPAQRSVSVTGYKTSQLEMATNAYLEAEKATVKSKSDAVLVSVSSLAALRRAYPNYFADTHIFNGLVHDTLKETTEPTLF